jgi:hypothetical protein
MHHLAARLEADGMFEAYMAVEVYVHHGSANHIAAKKFGQGKFSVVSTIGVVLGDPDLESYAGSKRPQIVCNRHVVLGRCPRWRYLRGWSTMECH